MTARIFFLDSGGVPRQLKRLAIRDSSTAARLLKRMFICDSGGVPRLVFSGPTLIPLVLSGSAQYPAAASAGVGFWTNGEEVAQTNQNPYPYSVGVFDPAGNGSAYDVRATLISGTAPNWPSYLNTLNTWFQVSGTAPGASNPSWGLQVQQPAGGSESCVLQLDLSLHGAATVISSTNVTLSVNELPQL
ncbi:MAG: hypothetical protein ACP5P4_05130 [Steroidobacteraceae bacterium]